MAAVTGVQMLLTNPRAPARLTGGRFTGQYLYGARSLMTPGSSHCGAGLKLRCMAEDMNEKVQAVSSAPDSKIPTSSTEFNPPPSPKPKVSTKFSDLFAFGGPAPERINGRLAMIGFVAAMAVELSNGQDLFDQITQGNGFAWFAGTSLLLSVASLVPLFKGVRAEAESGGLMNANAELWNGRLAMLGLVALAFTEYVKGGTLI
ncbi:hypothetical protein SAY87_001210 [Trapa incisa]|uniref:Early light-induced protein n=2 Tax=Trapa TaxID=22665 RepID=A0AAN7R8T8_TRANT|nr:hypothetical protein SAY87_001210 [Trapa incisa]KAK4790113.1 hypothetical protein SAY86_017417 [Trapa natans]